MRVDIQSDYISYYGGNGSLEKAFWKDKRPGLELKIIPPRLMFLQLKVAIDNMGARSGESLQKAILELMNSLIVKAGVDYKQVQRKTLVDAGGDVFFPGYSTNVDVVARDGEVHLFEVKYKADPRDFAHFLKVARLYEQVEKVHPGKLFLITLEISQKTLRATAHLPVEIIAGSVAL